MFPGERESFFVRTWLYYLRLEKDGALFKIFMFIIESITDAPAIPGCEHFFKPINSLPSGPQVIPPQQPIC